MKREHRYFVQVIEDAVQKCKEKYDNIILLLTFSQNERDYHNYFWSKYFNFWIPGCGAYHLRFG